jgi:SPP1 gp7 family putative phage head morphogenesis protein
MPHKPAKLDPVSDRLRARLHQKAIDAVAREQAAADACDRIAASYARKVMAALPTDEGHTLNWHRIREICKPFWHEMALEIDRQLRVMLDWSHKYTTGILLDTVPQRWFRGIVPWLPVSEGLQEGGVGSGVRGHTTAHDSGTAHVATLPIDTDHSTEQGIKAAAEKWYQSLDGDHQLKVETWTGGDHVRVRRGEVNGKPDREWDEALASAPKYNGTVYRAVSVSPDDLKGWNGDKSELTINASSSASRDPTHSGKFLGRGNGTLLKINTRNGRSIEAPSISEGINDEREVILPRASHYRVVKIDRDVTIHSQGKSFRAPYVVELEEKEPAKESRIVQPGLTEQKAGESRFIETEPDTFITVAPLREATVDDPDTDDPDENKTAEPVSLITGDEWADITARVLFPPPSEQTVSSIIYGTGVTGGPNWPQRLANWSKQQIDPDQLASTLATGLSQGKNLKELSADVKDQFQTAGSTAKRIARSEAHRVNLTTQDNSFKGIGPLMTGRMYQCQLDFNTRPTHAIYHGQVFALDEPLPGTLSEPNCRCHLSPVLSSPESIENDPNIAAQFANAAGRDIPDPSAYDQWFDQADEQQKRLAVGAVKYRLMKERLGTEPQWSDFLHPETGAILSKAELAAETTAQRLERTAAASGLIRQRGEAFKQVKNVGFLLQRAAG